VNVGEAGGVWAGLWAGLYTIVGVSLLFSVCRLSGKADSVFGFLYPNIISSNSNGNASFLSKILQVK